MKYFVLLLAVSLFVSGCRLKEAEKKAAPPQPEPPREALTPPPRPGPPRGSLVIEQPSSHQPGALKPYSVSPDLREVSNLAEFEKVFPLTEEQRKLLARQLFVANRTPYKQLFHVYENNDYHNLPSFVTTDVALHLYHCFFDYVLRTTEKEVLLKELEVLTTGALRASLEQLRQATKPSVRQALVRNAAYFATASRLLGKTQRLPPEVSRLVNRELTLINAHQGFARGAILPYMVDYSQFVPRGHYTRSPELRRYFLAMMWYGLTPFATRFADDTPCPEVVRQGVLMVRALERGKVLGEWGNIYEVTSHFAGRADDPIPPQWIVIADRVFGRNSPPDAVADDSKLALFIKEVEHLPPGRIRAEMIRSRDYPSPKFQMRLMGQRYLPDSEVLQRLSRPIARPFPSGLDVMAALGSRRAVELLDRHADVYNPNRWAGYQTERAKVMSEFARISARDWTANLYTSWLHALQPLLDKLPAGYPSFMLSDAWRDKSLHTALASWTELRHDTVLYGKQSAVECGDDDQRPMPTGYVEPNVPLYDRLLQLSKRTRQVVVKHARLTPELQTAFEMFEGLLTFLKRCAEKELKGKTLTREEFEEIRYIGGRLEYLTRATIEGQPPHWDLVDKGDQDMAIVTDVHTVPPKVLQEGVGRAAEILVIVPIGKKLVLTRGAILTYYEFTHPMAERLTNERWRELLDTPDAPEPPPWTRSFLLPPLPSDPEREQMYSYSSGC